MLARLSETRLVSPYSSSCGERSPVGVTKRKGNQSVMFKLGKLELIGPTGAVVVPGEFTWRWQRAGDHVVELDITVSKGTATVEAVRIVRESSRPSVTGDDLRRLPL